LIGARAREFWMLCRRFAAVQAKGQKEKAQPCGRALRGLAKGTYAQGRVVAVFAS
jgi:hypothetical protein